MPTPYMPFEPPSKEEAALIWGHIKAAIDVEQDARRWPKDHDVSIRRWSSEFEWPIEPSYGFTEDNGTEIIEATRSPFGYRRKYLPLAYSSLPFELSKVEYGNKESALTFVHKWGFLGFNWMSGPEKVWHGEPLGFIWLHAKAMRDILAIFQALQDEDEDALIIALDACAPVIENPDKDLTIYRNASLIVGANATAGYTVTHLKGKPTAAGISILTRVISDNIQDIHAVMYPTDYGRDSGRVALDGLVLGFDFDTLVEAIWWHLGSVVSGRSTILKCKECGYYFKQEHRRQVFCPVEDWKKDATEPRVRPQSACASRFHSRKTRRNKPKKTMQKIND